MKVYSVLLIIVFSQTTKIFPQVQFTAHTITTDAKGAEDVYAIDIDGDGDIDVLSASVFDDKIAWYENDGNENFISHTITSTADGACVVYTEDMDADGDIDVLSASNYGVAWYENDGNENFATHNITASANSSESVYAEDVDGDGDMDVLSASCGEYPSFDSKIIWYENDGNENFTQYTITANMNYFLSVHAEDVDMDGDVDVLSASAFDNRIAWYENDGNENFIPHTVTTDAYGAFSVYSADVDGDVDIDVLSASLHDDKIAWYENDGNENFTSHTITTDADGPRSVFAIDVDGDGYMDVLSASRFDSTIAWYENSLLSDTIHVPGEYPTIQTAIDAAINGDIVLVAEDTYYENINFKGKAITVASYFLVDGNESHIENTIIDGSQPSNSDSASVVSFKSGEDTNSVLCGFTITGGTGSFRATTNTRAGGGIVVYISGAKICNNIIEFNSVNNTGYNARGGGIFVGASYTTVINNNIIRNNSINGTYPFGGGIEVSYSGITYILSNKIIDNETIGTYASGGGIDVFYPSGEVVINGNYIKGNDAQVNGWGGGGIDLYNWEALITVSNNLIVDNSARWGGGILVEHDLETSLKSRDQKLPDNLVREIPFIVNNTIINNFGYVVGGIYGRGFTPHVMNSIVWGNTYNSGGQIGGTATVIYSDVEGGFPGEGNIDVNPSFADTLFHLADSSLCIGAGIDSLDIGGIMYYCPPFCYYAGPRPNPPGSMPDIGACESPLPVSGVYDDLSQMPESYSLAQNYPNPFNPTTTIKYGITERTFVELRIYDILGREIELLVNKEQDAGYYELNINASNLASGIYLYQLTAGSFIETKKMLLLK